jgi:hypothetical protein
MRLASVAVVLLVQPLLLELHLLAEELLVV